MPSSARDPNPRFLHHASKSSSVFPTCSRGDTNSVSRPFQRKRKPSINAPFSSGGSGVQGAPWLYGFTTRFARHSHSRARRWRRLSILLLTGCSSSSQRHPTPPNRVTALRRFRIVPRRNEASTCLPVTPVQHLATRHWWVADSVSIL
jgi:hypothetical protein